MATRGYVGTDVFSAALERMVALYADERGHRIVVSFSGGKDSTCVLEMCVMAARATGRLPVEVVLRDEEIMFPGVYEYVERVRQRDDIDFRWIVANQPIVNAYDRENPYFWVFDPALPPEEWFRLPPTGEGVEYISEKNIDSMLTRARYPVHTEVGQELFAAMGLRVQESRGRLYGLYASRGYLTGPQKHGVRFARPIYDWKDGDVWRAIRDNGWDYCKAYDTMMLMGVKTKDLRLAPPTMNAHGADQLRVAAAAWPRWFDRLCHRLPGVRRVALFGKRAIEPNHIGGESWETTFQRECVENAPEWIAERALKARERLLSGHSRHSTAPFPEIHPCGHCSTSNSASWRKLTQNIYLGDPFAIRFNGVLPYVEPEFFRKGAGTWEGTPAW